MATITKNLNGITTGELIAILKSVPTETKIYVWGADVQSINIEINTYDEMPADVDIEIETYPSWQKRSQKTSFARAITNICSRRSVCPGAELSDNSELNFFYLGVDFQINFCYTIYRKKERKEK